MGLSPERFWRLTHADYSLLKAVHDERRQHEYKLWAIERVEFRNANQMFGEENIPWSLEDMLGTGNREERAQKVRAEKIAADAALMKLQRGLGSVTADSAPEGLLPDWAKRQWDPKDYPELFK